MSKYELTVSECNSQNYVDMDTFHVNMNHHDHFIIDLRPSTKTMYCALKRILLNVCDGCVFRSLIDSPCCRHHRQGCTIFGTLGTPCQVFSLFSLCTWQRLASTSSSYSLVNKTAALLLCPSMSQRQCLLIGGPFYTSLCIWRSLLHESLYMEVPFTRVFVHKMRTALLTFAKFFVCLYVCLGFFVPLKEYFTHKETSPLPMKGCKEVGPRTAKLALFHVKIVKHEII